MKLLFYILHIIIKLKKIQNINLISFGRGGGWFSNKYSYVIYRGGQAIHGPKKPQNTLT